MRQASSASAQNRGKMLLTRSSRPSSFSRHHRPRIQWRWAATAVLVLSCLASQTLAADLPDPEETLVVDTRVPLWNGGSWTYVSPQELKRRDEPSAILPASVTSIIQSAPASTITTGTSPTRTTPSSTGPTSPLPSPFDSNLSSNFSNNNCASFISTFLSSSTFKQCYPFSMLLQGSRSFFNAERSLVSITQVLDASCAANVTFCTSYMNDLATNLTSSAYCATDYGMGNSVVVQAYLAAVSYQSLYSATCLKDVDTAQYCFANAITNLTTPDNAYFYYLPLNQSLPQTAMPSCNTCLRQTMNIFQNAAANRKQPISLTYVSAAQQVDAVCGPSFVNQTLPLALVQNLASARAPSWLLMMVSLLAAGLWLLGGIML